MFLPIMLYFSKSRHSSTGSGIWSFDMAKLVPTAQASWPLTPYSSSLDRRLATILAGLCNAFRDARMAQRDF
jgi:hypothetical protein